MMAAITWLFVLHVLWLVPCIYHLKCAWIAFKDPNVLLDFIAQRKWYQTYMRLELLTKVWIILIIFLGLIIMIFESLGW